MGADAGTVAAIAAGLNILFTVGGGFFFAGKMTARMDAHDEKTERIEGEITEVKKLLVSSAVEADRLRRAEADIQNIDHDLRNLRKGVGWIKDERAHGVDREY